MLALAIADVVTYSALQSFLYQRIDQQLEASHAGIERTVDSGQLLSCYPFPGQTVPDQAAIRIRKPPPTRSRCWHWRCASSRAGWSLRRAARPTWTAPTTHLRFP